MSRDCSRAQHSRLVRHVQRSPNMNIHSCNGPLLDSQLWAHCVGCVGFLVESTANYGPLVLWALASVASASSWSRPPTMGLLCYGPLASVASASSWSRPPTTYVWASWYPTGILCYVCAFCSHCCPSAPRVAFSDIVPSAAWRQSGSSPSFQTR